MSKELYLQAIEALRQRVAAAGDVGELAEKAGYDLGDMTYVRWEWVDDNLYDGFMTGYYNDLVNFDFEGFLKEAAMEASEDVLRLALVALAHWVRLQDLEGCKRIVQEMGFTPEHIEKAAETEVERRRFFAEESYEQSPDDDSRPDMPGVDAWDWVAVGSDDTFWEDDEDDGRDEDEELDEFMDEDENWEDDDPDYDDVYGDDEEDPADLLEDEKWQEADRRYEEDKLAELERLRDEEDDDDA